MEAQQHIQRSFRSWSSLVVSCSVFCGFLVIIYLIPKAKRACGFVFDGDSFRPAPGSSAWPENMRGLKLKTCQQQLSCPKPHPGGKRLGAPNCTAEDPFIPCYIFGAQFHRKAVYSGGLQSRTLFELSK